MKFSLTGGLLTKPKSDCDISEVVYNRDTSSYVNLSNKYIVPKKEFQNQYFYIYKERLRILRQSLKNMAKEIFGNEVVMAQLCELATNTFENDVFVIGILYKNQNLKPNVLKDLSFDQGLMPPPLTAKYTSDSDELVLEDELQRIRLVGNVNVNKLVTGIVCGVYGNIGLRGNFCVKNTCFPQMQLLMEPYHITVDSYIVFISGLELASDKMIDEEVQLAIDWICGESGEMADQKINASIERIIIVGNSLNMSTRHNSTLTKAKYLTKNSQAASIAAVKSLDDILVQLAASVDVDIMPGEFDPTNYLLPQQPLHHLMFPLASRYSTFHTVPNPYEFELAGRRFLGSSGQNVDDIQRNTEMGTPIDALEGLMRWGHFSPTSPDTLGCFPHRENDPFILYERPHVCFVGNQKFFQHRYLDNVGPNTQLLTIPRFSGTSSIVRLNLKTLECDTLTFQICSESINKGNEKL